VAGEFMEMLKSGASNVDFFEIDGAVILSGVAIWGI
jgi:hypothetical protein